MSDADSAAVPDMRDLAARYVAAHSLGDRDTADRLLADLKRISTASRGDGLPYDFLVDGLSKLHDRKIPEATRLFRATVRVATGFLPDSDAIHLRDSARYLLRSMSTM